MVLLRVLTMQGAYRGINWTTVVLVGAMIPLSTAMVQSGAADAHRGAAGGPGAGRRTVCAARRACSRITAVFGQLICNMATALIVIPIAVAAATGLGVSSSRC